MKYFTWLYAQLKAHFTRRRLLFNGSILMLVAAFLFYLKPENNEVAWIFAAFAFTYFGFYVFYRVRKYNFLNP